MTPPPATSNDDRLRIQSNSGDRDRLIESIGFVGYTAVLGAGYYYNLTFVQLGLIDLGTRRVGMERGDVSIAMAGFALAAFVVAVAVGRTMDRRGWSRGLRVKLRMLFAIVVAQTALTMVVVAVESPVAFVAWVAAGSVVIGTGIPVTFTLMSDLIAIRHRGPVAATVTGLAFCAAAVYPLEWRIERFAPVMSALMIPACAVFGVLAFRRSPLVERLDRRGATLATGRFRLPGAEGGHGMPTLVFLMFAVFFIDSLGFLRIIEAPAYISTSWQSPDVGIRLFIAGAHVVGAAMAGVLYTAFGRRFLLVWIFGLFAFAHLLYTTHIVAAPSGGEPPLVLPLFYVLAVSFYTTLNFALWPDMAKPRTLATTTAVGVGTAGWLASFLSTALAISSSAAGLSLLDHLRLVNALALVLAAGYPTFLYTRKMRRLHLQGVKA